MRFLYLLLLTASLSIAACRDKGPPPAKIKDDAILADYTKEIRKLTEESKAIQDHTTETKKRLKDLSMNPKISELLKKGLFQNQRFLDQIDQRTSYLKIQIANRQAYLDQNKATLTQDVVDQQFAEYLIDKRANPASKPWKSDELTDLDNPGAPKSILDGQTEVVDSPEKAGGPPKEKPAASH